MGDKMVYMNLYNYDEKRIQIYGMQEELAKLIMEAKDTFGVPIDEKLKVNVNVTLGADGRKVYKVTPVPTFKQRWRMYLRDLLGVLKALYK